MGLKRSVDPTVPLLTTAEAKLHLRIDHSDEDTYVDALVKAATYKVESYIRRSLLSQTWIYTLDRFPAWTINVPRPPAIAVSSLAYVDTDGASQTLSSSLYRVTINGTPSRITPVYGEVWPTTRNQTDAVTITYTAGYGVTAATVPEQIREAVRLIVGHWYVNRETVTTGTIVARFPQSAEWLLDGFKVKDWNYGNN